MNKVYTPQEFVDLAVNAIKASYEGQTPELRSAARSDLHVEPLQIANRFSKALEIGDLTTDKFNIHFEAGVVKKVTFGERTPINADEVVSTEPLTSVIGYFRRNEHSDIPLFRGHRYITIETKNFETVSSAYDSILPVDCRMDSDLKGLPLEEAVKHMVTLVRM